MRVVLFFEGEVNDGLGFLFRFEKISYAAFHFLLLISYYTSSHEPFPLLIFNNN
jgi:hypothetical protein